MLWETKTKKFLIFEKVAWERVIFDFRLMFSKSSLVVWKLAKISKEGSVFWTGWPQISKLNLPCLPVEINDIALQHWRIKEKDFFNNHFSLSHNFRQFSHKFPCFSKKKKTGKCLRKLTFAYIREDDSVKSFFLFCFIQYS